MPKYSENSRKKLRLAHTDLQRIFEEVIKYYDNTIVWTYRGQEVQDEFFENGKSKLKYPDSKHNCTPAMAVDSAPYVDGDVSDDMYQGYHYAGFVLGIAKMLLKEGEISHELVCGADWDGDIDVNDQTFRDLWHFQLAVPSPCRPATPSPHHPSTITHHPLTMTH